MFKRVCLLVLGVIVLYWTVAHAQQHPVMDKLADKVVHKYQQSSCEQLMQKQGEPKTPEEEKFIGLLHNNPQMRTEFLNKVAAPIANKMFECGLIP